MRFEYLARISHELTAADRQMILTAAPCHAPSYELQGTLRRYRGFTPLGIMEHWAHGNLRPLGMDIFLFFFPLLFALASLRSVPHRTASGIYDKLHLRQAGSQFPSFQHSTVPGG
jgi:hypothetical protein